MDRGAEEEVSQEELTTKAPRHQEEKKETELVFHRITFGVTDMKIKWSVIPFGLRAAILFGGVIAAVFAFSYFYDPVSLGKHIAKDGHQYSIGGVGHDCRSGRCNKFEIGYDCEGECAKEEMRHNAHDLMELAQPRLDRRHYQEFSIRTSRAPHGRGQVDSEVIFKKQPDGTWSINSEWYK